MSGPSIICKDLRKWFYGFQGLIAAEGDQKIEVKLDDAIG